MFCLANGQKIIYKWKQQSLCDIYVRRADFAADIAMLYGGKGEGWKVGLNDVKSDLNLVSKKSIRNE